MKSFVLVSCILLGCGGGGGMNGGPPSCTTFADCGCCECSACGALGPEVVPIRCTMGTCATCMSTCAAAGCMNTSSVATKASSCAGAIGCDHQGYPCTKDADCCGRFCSPNGFCS
jgi:hypothetical protein